MSSYLHPNGVGEEVEDGVLGLGLAFGVGACGLLADHTSGAAAVHTAPHQPRNHHLQDHWSLVGLHACRTTTCNNACNFLTSRSSPAPSPLRSSAPLR
eukprot:scaffold64203_cov32-Tisochrysis_lutea.AAC.1